MKKHSEKLRNTLTVRVNDADYENFLGVCGKNYSPTLRELINYYSSKATPEDATLPPKERIKEVLSR